VVLEAGRSYKALKRAVRSARPAQIARLWFARRAFGGSFAAGIAILGVIGLVAPDNFGQAGAAPLRSGWPSVALGSLIVTCVAYAIARREHLAWLGARVREPLMRPLEEHPAFSEAADALAACPAALRLRWAFGWVWGPVAWAIVGGTLAFSAAYFVVDALLAGLRVGPGQPLYALAFAVASLAVFAAAAGRLSTWRFASSVYKEVTTGYPR
jgi:hypothetical protein